MGRPHRELSKEEYAILFNQVNGVCPLCQAKLAYQKLDKTKHCKNIAHIYPLNPTEKEIKTYGCLPRLSEDIDSIDNMIMLCPNCHNKYDSVPTETDYMKLYNLKREMISTDEIRNTSYHNEIHEEIRWVIDKLYEEGSDRIPLEYEAVKINDKLGNSFDTIILRSIKDNVIDYYLYIRQVFAEREKRGPAIFDLIASQIRTTYLCMKNESISKEQTYEKMCEWFEVKTGCNVEISKVMISFFIQNCEVFDVPKQDHPYTGEHISNND